MKFFGLANQHIIDYKQRCKEMFCFDENGEFETDAPKLIEWIKKNKPFIRYEGTERLEKKPTKKPTAKKTAKGDKIKRNKK